MTFRLSKHDIWPNKNFKQKYDIFRKERQKKRKKEMLERRNSSNDITNAKDGNDGVGGWGDLMTFEK